MGSITLDSHETQQIQDLLKSPEPLIQKRARIVSLYAGGGNTQQIAREVSLSRSRTRFWRRQFELHRMQIFQYQTLRVRAKPSTTIVKDLAQTGPEPLDNQSASGLIAELTKPSETGLPFPAPFLKPGVLPDDPIAEAGRKVMLYHFAEMLRHEAGALAGEDIEALHDMRVATRRLRAAFDVFAYAFKPKTVKTHLKGLRLIGRALGKVRDLDVFIEKAGHYVESLPVPEQRGLDPLLLSWHRERDQLREALSAHMGSLEYQVFKHSFNRFVQTPGAGIPGVDPTGFPIANQVRHVAPPIIYSRLAELRAYDTIVPTASITQLHALRIEFKKLRYTLEYFQEVLGGEIRQVITEIKGMQDHLGDLQDANVACIMLSQFLDQWDHRQSDQLLSERMNPQPIVTYLANRHTERYNLSVSFPKAWAAFNNPDFQRNLALSIAVL